MSRFGLLPGATTALRRLVLALCALEFLSWLGGGAIVPLLPTYLHQHGAAPALVGVVMGSYFIAGMATQFPLGRLCDRAGPRAVVVLGLVLFALGSLGFAHWTGAVPGIAFRAVQGAGAGAVTVAASATIGYEVPLAVRGAAFGALSSSQMVALAIGPLIGSIIGAASMRWLFLASATVALGAIAPALVFLPRPAAPRQARASPRDARSPRFSAGVIGAAAVFVAAGLVSGLYDACWSLLLHLRGASSIAIGLSWTLYCLPFGLLAPASGRLADRADRRVLAVGGTFVSAAFALVYPHLHSVALLVGLGCFEAVGAVLVVPAALSLLSGAVAPANQGAAQGFVGSARTGATAVGAIGCGALFGVSIVLCFSVAGLSLAALGAAAWVVWRRVPGRVGRSSTREAAVDTVPTSGR